MVLTYNYDCQLCHKPFKNCGGLTAHLKFKHKDEMSYETYYLKYMNTKSIPGECIICGMPTKFDNLKNGYIKTCCSDCAIKASIQTQKQDNYKKAILSRSNTLKKKYNIESDELITSPFAIDAIKDKSLETLHNKFGENIDNPFQAESVKETIKQTMIKRYGAKTTLESNILKNKCKETLYNNYNVEHPSQSNEIQAKIIRKYKYNDIFFDSSWELAYYIWLTDNNIPFEYHPRTNDNFKYYWDGKIHRYFPDFKLNTGEYIELKNSSLLENMINNINTKEHIKYECMIKNNVKFLSDNEIKVYLDYVENKYNKQYLKQFRYRKEETL